jgi:transcriptional regulator with XRE-family HTH domain
VPTTPGAPIGFDEPVGAVLARMRRARRLTGAKLAAKVGMSQPKISRIERGRGVADPEDIALIARTLGASDSEVQALMERARRAHNIITDWRPTSAGLANRQDTLAGWELKATEVRDFQPALLTGLLQSSGYARAALAAFQDLTQVEQPQNREAGLRAAVAARIRRQQALADSTKTFHFVFTEWVLRNRICSPVDMLAQISSLRELNEQSNVKVSIIPNDAEVGIPALHGFVLYDDELVVIDLFNTGLTTRGHSDVAEYRQVFDSFARHATANVPATLDQYHEYYLDQIDRPNERSRRA